MARNYFLGSTIDDLMYDAIDEININGEMINPSKGPCKEITGVFLELSNPLARVSRSATRGKLFSGLGELCWYLSKDNSLEFIKYYISQYKDSADNGVIVGAYGPRLFTWKGLNQFDYIINKLTKNQESRRAVIQIYDATDRTENQKDVPCTCSLQFMIRQNKLDLITFMRSNDVYYGLPHDFFCFTMLQEIAARKLNVKLGAYKHMVGSLHLYETEKQKAKDFLEEGHQRTTITMPEMPFENPDPAIKILLKCENELRTRKQLTCDINDLAPYWKDLVYILQIYSNYKANKTEQSKKILDSISHDFYKQYVEEKIL